MSTIILILIITLSQVSDVQSKIPLIAEISPNHPLYVFACNLENIEPEYVKEKINRQWKELRRELRPYSALQLTFPHLILQDLGKVEDVLQGVFTENTLPFIFRLSIQLEKHSLPEPQELSAFFARFPNLIGICVSNFSLNLYPSESSLIYPDFYQIGWLSSLINTASRYGRLIFLPMNSFELVRLLSHPKGIELLDVIKTNCDYVVPGYLYDGDFAPIGLGALLGLYIGGYVNRIGVECSSAWYHRCYLVKPCVLGVAPPGSISIYSPLYRGMALTASLAGATVYSFPDEDSLWIGRESIHWTQVIENTLLQIVNLGLIPSKEMVQKKVGSGYRCFPANNPQDFWRLGETLFPQFSSGSMAEALYSLSAGKALPEIVPETGNNYILPLFPYNYSPQSGEFYIVGYQPVYPEWTWSNVVEKMSHPSGEGSAFITDMGKYLFVFNSSEHQFQRQSYRIALPAPVRKFTALRVPDGIKLSWGFREGDISYQVYRRYQSDSDYVLVARGIETQQWNDVSLDPSRSVSYSVTALTTEQEILEGFVNPGEYKVFSLVESRIAEEVVLLPEMNFAESVPINDDMQEEEFTCPDPINTLAPEEQEIANAIKNSLLMMESAIMRKDTEAVCAIFSDDYKDSISSGIGHVKCALLSFFNSVPSPKVLHHVRSFSFQKDDAGNFIVNTPLFFRIWGYKISDELGIKSGILVEVGPPENGETTLSWCKKDNLWVIKSSEKPIINLSGMN